MSIKTKVYKIDGKNYCLKELSIRSGVNYETLYRRVVRNNALPKSKRRTMDELSFNFKPRTMTYLNIEGEDITMQDYLEKGGDINCWGKVKSQHKVCPEAPLERLKLGRTNVVFMDGEYITLQDACRKFDVPPSTLQSRIEVYPEVSTEELLKNPPNALRGHKMNTIEKRDTKYLCLGSMMTRKQIAEYFGVAINTVYRMMRKHPDTPIENLFKKEGEYALNFGVCKTREIDTKEIT